MDEVDQSGFDDQYAETLAAREAAELLDVKLATLYAYTSRGLVRSVPGDHGRARRYLRADLERLKARKRARAGNGPVAAGALRFGEPVLDTSISSISAAGPIYRGRPALELAEAGTPFELVAELLWSGKLSEPEARERTLYFWNALHFGLPVEQVRAILPPALPPLPTLAAVVPLLATRDPGRFVERLEAVLPRARHLLRRMATALAVTGSPAAFERSQQADGVAAAAAFALGGDESCIEAVDRALVLCADHELNASSFAARVAASTGADLYACVSAALAALSGPRHGGATDRVEAALEQIDGPEAVRDAIHERARLGESLAGFGHPLYPDGDPRGGALLALAKEVGGSSALLETSLALVEAMEEEGRGGATIDVGLVALCAALGFGRGAAAGLFAVGRCAGWVAHALEQYEAGYVLRPRARYLGEG